MTGSAGPDIAFATLLVPLDGSATAEASLPLARRLARSLGARLVLFRAALAQTVPGLPQESPSEVIARAERYLARLESELRAEGLDCRAVVAYGQAADSILDNVSIQRAQLVVIGAHGYSGDHRWAQGSVAAKVVEGASAPVLTVPSPEGAGAGDTILLPHDGSPRVDPALGGIAHLAVRLDLEVAVLAVDTSVSHLADWTRVLDSARNLSSLGARVRVERCVGDPSREVLLRGSSGRVAFVVVTARSSDRADGWLDRTVVDRVVHGCARPVLLLRGEPGPALGLRLEALAEQERCYNCGRENYRAALGPADRCPRCGFFLRSCGNCANYDGIVCQMENPWTRSDVGTSCSDFEFRRSRLTARRSG